MKLLTIFLALMSLTYRTYGQRYTVPACKDGRLMLNCRFGTILIHDVILADSTCTGSRCCPRQDDCKGSPSENYRSSVLRSCNGRTSCETHVEIRDIGCSFWAPKNDYVNISYECQVQTTTTVATSPSIATTFRRIPVFVHATQGGIEAPNAEVTIRTSAKLSDDSTVSVTEKEKEERYKAETTVNHPETVTTSSAIKPGLKSNRETEHLPQGENEAFKQSQADNPQHPDRMTIMTALIVGGVVITATVISATVVMVLKKRRIPKTEEPYDLPNIPCTGTDDVGQDNGRNSNFYDCIPDFREFTNCSIPELSKEEEEEAVKENDYLRPIIDDDEHPYVWVP